MKNSKIVVFNLGEQLCGIQLEVVERVVRMVAITPLPDVTAPIAGVINVKGEIVPVLDLRQKFGQPHPPLDPSDQLIITRWGDRSLALTATSVHEVRNCPETSRTDTKSIIYDLQFLQGIAKHADGLILLQNLENLFSLLEHKVIQEAVKGEQS